MQMRNRLHQGVFYDQGFRMKRFRISAAKVKASSIMNVAVYPPVISRTLLDAVAMREPPITVKVISAMLVEKYFIPKKEDVKADVMVGHAP